MSTAGHHLVLRFQTFLVSIFLPKSQSYIPFAFLSLIWFALYKQVGNKAIECKYCNYIFFAQKGKYCISILLGDIAIKSAFTY